MVVFRARDFRTMEDEVSLYETPNWVLNVARTQSGCTRHIGQEADKGGGENARVPEPCCIYLFTILEGAARYAGLLRGHRHSAKAFFCPYGKKSLSLFVLAQMLVFFCDQ